MKMRASGSSVGKVVRVLAINAVVLMGLLLLVEAVLRLADVRPPRYFSTMIYENDPMTGVWHAPSQVAFSQSRCFRVDAVHVNQFGMRDRERALAATGPRIALVGDSMTEGMQVGDEQTVSRQLEELLAGRAEVLNFGVSSTGTSVQLLQYHGRVRKFRPDIVVVMFAVVNDIDDNQPALKRRIDPVMGAVSPYLLLDAAGTLTETPQPGQFRRTSALVTLASATAIGQWTYHTYLEIRGRMASAGNTVAVGATSPADDQEEAWAITEQVLLRFNRDVLHDGGRFGLVVIPSDDPQVTGSAVNRLEQVARRGSFPMLDLRSRFAARAGGASDAVRFPCDLHWNARGHKEAAIALRDFLEEQGWLEPK